jgi:predicted GNAT superfamily acetyltransferase
MQIRNAAPEDFAQILALNEASVQFLSPLGVERLTTLHAQAAYHRVVATSDGIQAFLLALREGADYESLNYQWFSARLTAFLYMDRVVVAPSAQGRGYGKRLYEDLIAYAEQNEISPITCEFEIEPLNAASQRLHQEFGFTEVGSQYLGAAGERVSMQALSKRQISE